MSISSILSRFKKNNDAKTVAKNFVFLSLIKVAGFVFPLIVLPYLTRTIGVDNFGLISFAASIIVFFETFSDWGFNYTATRDVAQNRENIDAVSRIYSEVFWGRTLLMSIAFAILIGLTFLFPSLGTIRLLLILTFLYIPGNTLCSEWVFQAFERMGYITWLNLLSKLVFTLLIFVVIRNPSDYIFQPLLYALGFILSGFIAQIMIYRRLGIKFYIPSFRGIMQRIKRSTDMFVSLFLPNLYTNFTTILLKQFGGDYATGIYSGGQRLQAIIDTLTQTLSRSFFPFLARHKEKHHVYALISGSISIVACLIMFFGADWFVHVFLAPGFEESATVMKIFSITPFFLFLMNTYGTNGLVIHGKENILRNIILFCSIFGFILTWIITVMYGFIGAAITLTSVWGVRGILTYIYAKLKCQL